LLIYSVILVKKSDCEITNSFEDNSVFSDKFISIQEKFIDFYNNKLSVIGLKLKPEYLF